VCYWELVDAKMVQEFKAHTRAVCSLSMHPLGTMLVTASNDGTIKVWT
jgi:WD40 repeat protein